MEPGQIDELRRWGRTLAADDSDRELRAAGRAILLLLDEVDRLRTEVERLASPPEDEPPAPPPSPSDERRQRARQKRRRGLFRLALALGGLSALVFATLALGARLSAPKLDGEGLSAGAQVGPALLPSLKFSVGGSRTVLDGVRWKLDGVNVTNRAFLSKGRLVFDGSDLGDGRHTLSASVSGGFPGSRTTRSWRFTVDTTGPEIRLDPPGTMIPAGKPLRVSGMLEPDATLIADSKPILVKDGRFQLAWKARPTRAVTLLATDTLRNATTKRIWISIQPRRPAHPVRAVHVTFDAWADPTLRQGVLDLIDQGRINAVELDLKDESGRVGFGAAVPLGRLIGAVKPIVDLRAAVKLLHEKGVRVIGRLVCFRDPIHAKAAWQAGKRSQVIQSPDGTLYAATYGGFTNFANPVVRRYQIDVAVAAAKTGIDEVLYDYVRRPDGPISSMVFAGLKGTPEQAIVGFLAESRAALKPYKTFLGASVFGIAASRPTEVGQDIPAMAGHVDYIAPMVYPSHWGPGEYGVASPNADPYDIVRASLTDFRQKVRGTGARIVPWLQDFSLGVTYGPAEVGAEIEGARDAGVDEFLLWDPSVSYTADALSTDAMTATFRRPVSPAEAAKNLQPNELGLVPVIMHHQIRADVGGAYDQTPAEFRAELERLWSENYYPVRASDLVSGSLKVPKGKTPVVLTFDDSTKEQFAYLPDGRVKPDTAIGILLDFASKHPGFPLAGTFYVLRDPFAGVPEGPQMLRWLAEHGFELGDHTKDHVALSTLDPENVQRELVEGRRVITDAVPGAKVRTMALPLGAMPKPASLAMRGTWGGQSYSFAGVFLAGAEPSHSPFAKKFDPAAIPRIRTTHTWSGQRDFTLGYWFDVLEKGPQLRYVSDGDPGKITFPASLSSELAPKYKAKANPV